MSARAAAELVIARVAAADYRERSRFLEAEAQKRIYREHAAVRSGHPSVGVHRPECGACRRVAGHGSDTGSLVGEYQRANLFVGRYRTGLLGRVGDHIGLPDANIRILRGHDFEDGWRETPNGAYWLIIEHGDFWPVMVRLDDEDIAALRLALPWPPGYVQWTYTTTAAGQRPL